MTAIPANWSIQEMEMELAANLLSGLEHHEVEIGVLWPESFEEISDLEGSIPLIFRPVTEQTKKEAPFLDLPEESEKQVVEARPRGGWCPTGYTISGNLQGTIHLQKGALFSLWDQAGDIWVYVSREPANA